ncbi:MAG: 4Fe-4S binding protein [Clostridia bacterium]|jgi:ferredoxin
MKRKLIKIDEEKCNGCGACAEACNEGAIGLVDGKARLLRDDYCDGLGNCLPVCPTGAITFEDREADAYDEKAVKEKKERESKTHTEPMACGCPGTAAKTISRGKQQVAESCSCSSESQLMQWPVQIKLVPVQAPYFENANLLVAADCTAYAYADFHNRFIKNRIALIGCPKLDDGNYADKLTQILIRNNIKSVTIVRMEVPCCGGLEFAVKEALKNSGKIIPWQVTVISTDGQILE